MATVRERPAIPDEGEFDYELCKRNDALSKSLGLSAKPFKTTGTTIAGLLFKDGVILGADTRSTNGDTVADKNCEKIHYMASNMRCCGAGTSADTSQVTAQISARLSLHSYATGRQPRVSSAVSMLKSHLFKYQGYVGAYLVLGGVDAHGPHLFSVNAAGSTDALPFVTLGSGSLAAMSLLESEFQEGLERKDALQLLTRAIKYGMFNDNGSGSNVDLCVLTSQSVEYLRNYEVHMRRPYQSQKGYPFPKGTAPLAARPKKPQASIADPSVFDWRDFAQVEHSSMEVG